MPVEPAGFVDKQVARVLRYTSRSDEPHTHYRKTENNQVLHGDTSTLRTAIVVHSWPRSNIRSIIQFARTSLWCYSRPIEVTVDFHLFTSNSKIRCWPKITCYIYIWARSTHRNVWECSRNCWNSTVNRWPRSTIRSMEQFAHSYLLTISMHFRGTSRLWYNFSLWRSRFFPKSHNERISKLFATCR